nr:MAG TPA: Protein of unknown function (DUF3102) [Caudoviricetes sp.]
MSMYDTVDTAPEGYSEGEELSKMFSEDDMSEAFEERDIDVITEEINFYKQQAGMAILEIGKRLVEAKEQLSHGEWLPWLEKKVEFSERSAQQYIRLWREYGKSATVADLGVRKALVLLALPDTERDSFAGEKHEVNGEEKTAAEMTVKELEKAVAERNAAREEAEKAKADLFAARAAARDARSHVEELQGQLEELKNRPTEVAIEQRDATEEQLAAARQEVEKAAARRMAELEDALEKAHSDAAAAEERKEAAEAELRDAERERDSALDVAQGYKAEAEAAHKMAAAASSEGMTKFKVVFDQTVENVNTLATLLQALPDSQQEKLRRALLALADQVRKVGT